MKFDTSGISRADLAKHLEQTYGFPIAFLSFTPKGEEAYSYVATDPLGEPFFVRLQPNAGAGDLEGIYAKVAALRGDGGIPALLAPQRTTTDRFTSRFESFTVALFPFVAGTTAYETVISEAHWRQMAEIMAVLHTAHVPMTARETFANPFAGPIHKALQRAASAAPPTSTYQRQTIALLREHRSDVLDTLRCLQGLGQSAHRLAPPFVPTHGDPNLANFLLGDDGALYLTDWGELALGPRERDLTSFTGERFASFLRRYLEVSGRVRLHRTLFAFYFYRWVAQEIADYTARLLFGSGDSDEEAHAWEELQPYLPAQRAEIESGVNAIMQVLTGLEAEGLVEVEASRG